VQVSLIAYFTPPVMIVILVIIEGKAGGGYRRPSWKKTQVHQSRFYEDT
jgi:hypothetical protein